jgi:hypothetical protein
MSYLNECSRISDLELELAKSSNKINTIEIEELNRGYIVRVGCQRFAFSQKEELVKKLTEYINEPYKTEKKWYEGSLF